MPLSRRQFIARLAGVPGLLALPRPGTLARPLGAPSVRASLGFPDAGIQWRGDSSLSAALRAGVQVPHRERLERPARPQPFDWDAAGVVLRARFPDAAPFLAPDDALVAAPGGALFAIGATSVDELTLA